MNRFIFLVSTILISSAVLAGGSIFGGHKSRTSNPEGVSSIGIHICGELNCPDVILKKGDCGLIPNTTMQYGVCTCSEGYRAVNGECILDNCGKHGTLSDGVCVCDEGWYGKLCDSDCNGYKDKDGKCHTCSVTTNFGRWLLNNYEATPKECARCDETDYPRTIFNYEGKTYCVLVECPQNYFRLKNGSCRYCSSVNSFTTAETCAQCDETDYPRTIFNYEGKTYCALVECPQYHFRLEDGSCVPCLNSESYLTTQELCTKCNSASDYSYLRRIFNYEGKTYCGKIYCSTTTEYFHTLDGSCIPCSSEEVYRTTAQECASCRKVTRNLIDGQCILAKCSDNSDCGEERYCEAATDCSPSSVCSAISNISVYTGTLDIKGITYSAYCSKTKFPSYFQAENWCQALGGRMLTADETCPGDGFSLFECPTDSETTSVRDQVKTLCLPEGGSGRGKDWVWTDRSDKSTELCKAFSFNYTDSRGEYRGGSPGDRVAVCVFDTVD